MCRKIKMVEGPKDGQTLNVESSMSRIRFPYLFDNKVRYYSDKADAPLEMQYAVYKIDKKTNLAHFVGFTST